MYVFVWCKNCTNSQPALSEFIGQQPKTFYRGLMGNIQPAAKKYYLFVKGITNLALVVINKAHF